MFDEFDTDESNEISKPEFVYVIMQILEVKDARDIPIPMLNRRPSQAKPGDLRPFSFGIMVL